MVTRAKKIKEVDVAQGIVSAMKARYGVQSVTVLSKKTQALSQVKEVIPTGIDVIDKHLLPCGGIPIGRVTVCAGAEGCGKTSFAYLLLAAIQRAGGVGVFSNSEMSFDEDRAKIFGVDLEKLIIFQPENFEQAVDVIPTTIKAHNPVVPLLFVWDSVASSVPESELGAPSKQVFSKRSQAVNKLLQEVVGTLPKKRAHLFIINQLRDAINVMFGPKQKMLGGKSLYYFPSWIMQMFPAAAFKDANGDHTGRQVTCLVTKSRFSPPMRKARMRLDYATGWNNEWATLKRAKDVGAISGRPLKGQTEEQRLELARGKMGWLPGQEPTQLKEQDAITKDEEE